MPGSLMLSSRRDTVPMGGATDSTLNTRPCCMPLRQTARRPPAPRPAAHGHSPQGRQWPWGRPPKLAAISHYSANPDTNCCQRPIDDPTQRSHLWRAVKGEAVAQRRTRDVRLAAAVPCCQELRRSGRDGLRIGSCWCWCTAGPTHMCSTSTSTQVHPPCPVPKPW